MLNFLSTFRVFEEWVTCTMYIGFFCNFISELMAICHLFLKWIDQIHLSKERTMVIITYQLGSWSFVSFLLFFFIANLFVQCYLYIKKKYDGLKCIWFWTIYTKFVHIRFLCVSADGQISVFLKCHDALKLDFQTSADPCVRVPFSRQSHIK